jgi:membrane protease YdiL (CAAX protease family)
MAGNFTEKFIPTTLQDFFVKTRSYFFGLLSILFLLLLYEGFSAALYENQPIQVRNSAELILKRAFLYFGPYGPWLLWTTYLLLLVWAYWQAKNQQLLDFKFIYFIYIVFESTLYALAFGLLVSQLTAYTTSLFLVQTSAPATDLSGKVLLAIGAGVYEELLFRFMLISFLLLVFNRIAGGNRPVYIVLTLFIGAMLFSGFHYVGGREVYTFDSFLFRFYWGVILGSLFVIRGLGVAVYTHTIYDMLLIFR